MTKQHPTEKDVKEGVKRILTKHGWFFWATPTGTIYGKGGVSDFCALRRHVYLAIETKHGNRRPTDAQIEHLCGVNNNGGFGLVVNEDLLPVLDAFLTCQDEAEKRVAEHMRAIQEGRAKPGSSAQLSREDELLMLNAIRSMTWWLAGGK